MSDDKCIFKAQLGFRFTKVSLTAPLLETFLGKEYILPCLATLYNQTGTVRNWLILLSVESDAKHDRNEILLLVLNYNSVEV